ncbi:MAG: SDR family oxidoreductase [Rhodospirillaceae bacterium]
MTTLVVGATGKTGRPLVEQLLGKNHKVRVVVRSSDKFSADVLRNTNLTVIEEGVLSLTDEKLAEAVMGCDSVVSCLGHNLDFQGMFGEPKALCTDAVRRLCEAIKKNGPNKPVKFILMNTVGVPNTDLEEKRTWFERQLLTLLRHAIPPHRDNETAAEYLHKTVGKVNNYIEWCCVRPDSLIDADVSPYEIKESPSTGIFSGRPTARSNVAHFMTEMVENAELWSEWKYRMPVIMNA